MAKYLHPNQLGAAIGEELKLYGERVAESVDAAGEKAIKDLVQKTRATAPKMTGDYKRRITSTVQSGLKGMKHFIWHVKAPDYRLTHLLVHGHATVNGGRTKADPFLHNAVDEVLPEYERAVEEAIKNA